MKRISFFDVLPYIIAWAYALTQENGLYTAVIATGIVTLAIGLLRIVEYIDQPAKPAGKRIAKSSAQRKRKRASSIEGALF